jgi:2-oxoglutarate dehydrogenase complex dehydrogenase (E1) component-like enzyme
MINPDNLLFVEEVYQKWSEDPNSVSQEWKDYFSAQEMANNGVYRNAPSFRPSSLFAAGRRDGDSSGPEADIYKQERVDQHRHLLRTRTEPLRSA